jgi:cobyrinic acid a,c-diamide synthase
MVIAATGSGVGKTSVTLGLVSALRERGLRVQTFKTGPDFLDPSYLTLASGRPCYNLDGWMCGREYVASLFARATQDADIALIEGAMGLFDGADAATLAGSTAEIALWLDAPVVLVASAKGAARSVAATVFGFVHFDSAIRVAGVVANHSGSPSHEDVLKRSLEAAGLPPLVGALGGGSLPALPSRHLGLVSADVSPLGEVPLRQFGEVTERCLSLEAILQLARNASPISVPTWATERTRATVRIAIARDSAFHFYYPDNLEALEEAGAELVYFSPLKDACLPESCAGLYIGGGYPEVHAAELAANHSMLESVRGFAGAGHPVYAECGGLMYLSQGIESSEEERHTLAGILPVWTRMLARRKALGYIEAIPLRDSLFERSGVALRGHEFHYSEIIETSIRDGYCPPAYSVRKPREASARLEGFHRGNVLASYVHVHFASHAGAASRLVQMARESMHGTK